MVSCCLSANGIRFLGILLPPGTRAPLTVGLRTGYLRAHERLDDVADVPDVVVHARQHPPAAEPECDELPRLGVPGRPPRRGRWTRGGRRTPCSGRTGRNRALVIGDVLAEHRLRGGPRLVQRAPRAGPGRRHTPCSYTPAVAATADDRKETHPAGLDPASPSAPRTRSTGAPTPAPMPWPPSSSWSSSMRPILVETHGPGATPRPLRPQPALASSSSACPASKLAALSPAALQQDRLRPTVPDTLRRRTACLGKTTVKLRPAADDSPTKPSWLFPAASPAVTSVCPAPVRPDPAHHGDQQPEHDHQGAISTTASRSSSGAGSST